MSIVPYNETWRRQHRMLTPATFKKAVISSVSAQNFTADVYYIENPQTVIRAVPLASHINAAKVLSGDRCRVDLFDEKNSRDAVVAYIYGRYIA